MQDSNLISLPGLKIEIQKIKGASHSSYTYVRPELTFANGRFDVVSIPFCAGGNNTILPSLSYHGRKVILPETALVAVTSSTILPNMAKVSIVLMDTLANMSETCLVLLLFLLLGFLIIQYDYNTLSKRYTLVENALK
jgi:hypothetical protein